MGRLRRYRSSRLVASILLLLALWGAPHKQQDDAACLPLLEGEHDASKHALAPVDNADGEHCAICHWIRALKPSFSVVHAGAVEPRRTSETLVPDAAGRTISYGARLPARAPPAAS